MKAKTFNLTAFAIMAILTIAILTQPSWAGRAQKDENYSQLRSSTTQPTNPSGLKVPGTGGEGGFVKSTPAEKTGVMQQTGFSGSRATYTVAGGEIGYGALPAEDPSKNPTGDGNPGGRGGEYGFDVIISVLGLIWSAIP